MVVGMKKKFFMHAYGRYRKRGGNSFKGGAAADKGVELVSIGAPQQPNPDSDAGRPHSPKLFVVEIVC